jgi:hypothetical protein
MLAYDGVARIELTRNPSRVGFVFFAAKGVEVALARDPSDSLLLLIRPRIP